MATTLEQYARGIKSAPDPGDPDEWPPEFIWLLRGLVVMVILFALGQLAPTKWEKAIQEALEYQKLDQPAAAERIVRDVLIKMKESGKVPVKDYARAQLLLSQLQVEQDRLDDAARTMSEAINVIRWNKEFTPIEVARALQLGGRVELLRRRYPEAVVYLEEALQRLGQAPGEEPLLEGICNAQLAWAYLATGSEAAAARARVRSIPLLESARSELNQDWREQIEHCLEQYMAMGRPDWSNALLEATEIQ